MKVVNKEDLETVKKFQKHHFMSTLKFILIIVLAFIILGCIFILNGNESLGGFAIIFAIVYMIIYPITFFLANKKLNNSNKSVEVEKIIETEFYDDKITSKSYVNDELVNQLVYRYNELYKVDENNESFYIYIALNMAICISKKEISEIDVVNIRSILKSNCKKYKTTRF